MSETNIRPFVRSDQATAQMLILNGLGEHFGFIDHTKNPDLDDIVLSYGDAGAVFLVAERDGELVGTGAVIREGDMDGRLVRVSVSPHHRRLGIGSALVRMLLIAARGQGYARVWVETNQDWHKATALYGACGFREDRRDEESIHMVIDLE